MYLQPHKLIKQPDLNSGIEMELNWLEDFISLANTGSFSKAATHRNVSQANSFAGELAWDISH
jgi:hypothetical protein